MAMEMAGVETILSLMSRDLFVVMHKSHYDRLCHSLQPNFESGFSYLMATLHKCSSSFNF